MYTRNISILMASAALLGSSLVGCSRTGQDLRPALASDGASSAASRIETALARKDYARALIGAEQLVAAEPRNGNARALLGRAYLANGRYVSARTAFKDAMTLGNSDPRTIVSLALCETGLNDPAAAQALLASHVQDIPAGDYGLAMTIAGDPREGVRALLEAVNMPDATAKTRQNLAYALAMEGAWAQARLVAGQDLSAKDAEARVGQWASAAREGNEPGRVVAMIGVAPRADDAGMPQQLALDNDTLPQAAPFRAAKADDLIEQASQQASAADTEPAPAPAAAPVPSHALAQVPAQPREQASLAPSAAATGAAPSPSVEPAALAAAFPQAESKPSLISKTPAAQTHDALAELFARNRNTSTQVPASAVQTSHAAKIAPPVDDVDASDWVIQLGAYDSEAVAHDKWQRISAHREALKNFSPINSVFEVGGRTFHRLAIRGFGDRESALSTCSALRESGQACFVRLDDTNATQMARAEARSKAGRQAAGKSGTGVAVASR